MPLHYRIADVELSRAGDGQFAAYSHVSAAAVVLSNHEAALLRSCQSWLPLEEHALNWCRRQQLAPLETLTSTKRWAAWALKPILSHVERRRESLPVAVGEAARTKQRLEELAQKGFLVSAESFAEDCRRHAGSTGPSPIASIGITTRNRAGVLRRGLVSQIENRRQYERSTGYVIIDDGADTGAQSRTRAELVALRRDLGAAIRYAGRAERRRFAAALARESGLSGELIEFALFGLPACPVTTGAARNCLLLATAGDRLVMVDDDSVCRLAACPAREQGFALTSRRDPTEFWFFADPQSTLKHAGFTDIDFVGLHESLLGRAAGDCLPAAVDLHRLDLRSASPAFDSRLRLWGGRVRATMAGVVGDSGIGATGYLFVDSESQKRLTLSEESYLAAVCSRQVLRCVRRPTISEGTSCIAVNLGLDNTSLLPPFIPVQRNSDGLFARTLRLCFRDGYLGYLPWVMLHEPDRPRQHSLDDYWRHIRQVRTPDLVIHLMQASGAPDGEPGEAAALRRLGAQFETWGALDEGAFDELLQRQVWRSVAGVLSGANHPEAPPAEQDFYERYRQKYAGILRERVTEREYLLPYDLQQTCSEVDVRALARQIIRRFGELLQAWPEMYSAAVRLRERGLELAPLLVE
jgi:hypothetical protein